MNRFHCVNQLDFSETFGTKREVRFTTTIQLIPIIWAMLVQAIGDDFHSISFS